MLFELDFKADVCILRLKGPSATAEDAENLRIKTDEIKTRGCRKIIVDFANVPYLDSTGISFVVGLYTTMLQQAAGQFVLTNLTSRVRHVLGITRLTGVMPIFDDEEAATAALNGEEQ